jgi:pimeloyl-ACP methyl ester carboxylesterase
VSAPSPEPPTIRFVDVDGIRLRTSVRGSGRAQLLITGLGVSLDLAAPFERELTARGVQEISFDAPGTGQSAAYPWPRRIPGVTRTVERMLDVLGYERVDVLGVSFGGVMVQQLVHQAPHRVSDSCLHHRSRSRRCAGLSSGAAVLAHTAALSPAGSSPKNCRTCLRR